MEKSKGLTPLYQRLFVVFIATFAIMSVYELWGGVLTPANPDWQTGTVTILFISIISVVIAFFPLRAYHLEVEKEQAEAEKRVAIEKELRKSETKFREIFNNANDAVFIHEISPEGPGKFLDVNNQLCTMLGYTREEMLTMSIPDIDAPGQDVNVPGIISTLFKEGKVVFRIEHIAKDGRRIPVEVSARLIRSESNPVVLAIVRDISERKRFEQDLSFRNTLLAAQQEATLDAILIVDEKNKVFSFNNRFLDMMGIPRGIAEKGDDAAMMKLSLEKVADPAQFLARVRYLENEHPEETSRDEIAFRDGRIFDRYSAPMYGPDHRYYGRIWYFRDITDIKTAERALRESEGKFRGIFDSANDPIQVHDFREDGTPGKFIDVNEAACRMVGYTREEILSKGPLDLVTGYHSRPIADILRDYENTGRSNFEAEQRRKDGTIVPVEINATVITYGGKKSILAILRDITERKQMLSALQRTNEKLNLMNSITRHDILNQLTGVRGYLGLVEASITDPQNAAYLRNVDDAASAIERQIEFTRLYQDLGVRGPRWQDVENTIRQAVSQIDLGAVTLSCSVAGLELYADPLLERVFYNLADNALRYGGTIRGIRVHHETRDGSLVLIWEDDGVGIPAGEKSLIFNRGFGKHTGLGLFLVREILALTGITISETGEPEKGARFEIAVPKEAFRFDGTA